MSLFDPNYFTIAEDIRHIQRTWSRGTSDEELRRGSAILRRFLVDGGQGLLVHAWRAYGFPDQPRVVAPDLRAACGEDLSAIALGLAGGGNVDGSFGANLILNKGPTVPEPLPVENGTTAEREWRLLDFVDAPSVILAGEPVSRRQVVNYFANYLGGIHLAARTRKAEEKLIRRMKHIRGAVNAFFMDGLTFELLSIGQLLVGAGDIDRLAVAIENCRSSGHG